jgi:hypothetical protein
MNDFALVEESYGQNIMGTPMTRIERINADFFTPFVFFVALWETFTDIRFCFAKNERGTRIKRIKRIKTDFLPTFCSLRLCVYFLCALCPQDPLGVKQIPSQLSRPQGPAGSARYGAVFAASLPTALCDRKKISTL